MIARIARPLPLLLATLLASAGLPAQESDPVRDLEKGLKNSAPAARVAALQAHEAGADPRAVSLVVKALRDKDRGVRYAALESLRFSGSKRALEGLHRMAKSDRTLQDDPELHAALYKAIGQYGSETSLPILASELLVQRDRRVTQAGLLSIANVRSKKSAEQLISLMRSAGRNRVQAHMTTLRLALVVLTGADEGVSQDGWNAWWNDNKGKLRIAETLPPLKEEDRRAWDAHWGIRRRSERALRRHERGTGDPE